LTITGFADRRSNGSAAGYPHGADAVSLQHGGHCGRVEILSAVGGAEDAGVVDEHIQRGQAGHRGVDRFLVGHVQPQHPRAEGTGGVAAIGVAHARVDGVAGLDEAPGGFQPEAAVASGDQCRGHASTLLPGSRLWVCTGGTTLNPAPAGMLEPWTNSPQCCGPGGTG